MKGGIEVAVIKRSVERTTKEIKRITMMHARIMFGHGVAIRSSPVVAMVWER
jgi:hypothetical protein